MKNEIQHIAQDEQYRQLLRQVIERAKMVQYRTSIGMNQEQIRFYWSIGKDMSVAKAEARWGSKFYHQFSRDLMTVFPNQTGFSVRNLQYISQMYRVFTGGNIIMPQAVAQLPTTSFELTPQPVAQMSCTPLDYISLVPYYALRIGKVATKDKRKIERREYHMIWRSPQDLKPETCFD